jgi:hypothetical protein
MTKSFKWISQKATATPEWLCRQLIQHLTDVKAYVAIFVERDPAFDLKGNYGLDPAPLRNLNAPSPALIQRMKSVFSMPHERLNTALDITLREIREMLDHRALGANTGGKMAFVRQATGTPLRLIQEPSKLCESLVMLRSQALVLLQRQLRRLGPSHRNAVVVERYIQRIRAAASDNDLVYHRLRDLCANDPRPAVGFESFTDIYRDEILQLLADSVEIPMPPSTRYLRRSGIEVAYAPRNVRFLELGDAYGDCTASIPIRHRQANIFQTVYAWMLDPFYRVLEVHLDGDPLLKGHILPLLVREKPCLVLDAVETVPKLRATIKGRDNPFLSRRAWTTREDLMSALLATVFEIADRMGTDCVLAERFSNTDWVRRFLDSKPRCFAHVSEIKKPFGQEPVRRAVENESGLLCQDFPEEIQAMNTELMDEGLRGGYKELALLRGDIRPSSLCPLTGP